MKTKKVKEDYFTLIDGTNAWFESNRKGEPFFDRGEVEAAKKVWEAFPDFEVRTTIGPYRFYDVLYKANWKKKLVIIDFYSPRPGTGYIPSLIEEMKVKKAKYERKQQLKTLRSEYIQLRMADELDDVDVSLSTTILRPKRITEIGDEVIKLTEGIGPLSLIEKWEKAVQRKLKKVTHRASGGPYP